jgi:hypothetical protein
MRTTDNSEPSSPVITAPPPVIVNTFRPLPPTPVRVNRERPKSIVVDNIEIDLSPVACMDAIVFEHLEEEESESEEEVDENEVVS